MTADDKLQAAGETQDSAVPANPEERAFSGHPDHPPSTPDQPLEGNEELLRRCDDEAEPSSEAEEDRP